MNRRSFQTLVQIVKAYFVENSKQIFNFPMPLEFTSSSFDSQRPSASMGVKFILTYIHIY